MSRVEEIIVGYTAHDILSAVTRRASRGRRAPPVTQAARALLAAVPVIDVFFKGFGHVMAADYDSSGLLKLDPNTGDAITKFSNDAAKDAPASADAFVSLAGVARPHDGPDHVRAAADRLCAHRGRARVEQPRAAALAGGLADGVGAHAAHSMTRGGFGNALQFLMLRSLVGGYGLVRGTPTGGRRQKRGALLGSAAKGLGIRGDVPGATRLSLFR